MEIQQTKDTIVDSLMSTEDKPLEIMANLNGAAQMYAVLEGFVAKCLNSKVGANECELLLRLSVSYRGRGRDDLTGIGKTPDIQGWRASGDFGDDHQ